MRDSLKMAMWRATYACQSSISEGDMCSSCSCFVATARSRIFWCCICCRENKSGSMRRLAFNSCSLLANIKCNAVCIFFLRITAFFYMVRKINIDFWRRICRLALAASAMFIYVSLKLLAILTAFTGTVLGTAKKNGV